MKQNNYWVMLREGDAEEYFERDASMKEQFQFHEDTLPVRYYDKHKFYIDWHWHEEVEITEILTEELVCEIGTERLTLKKGDCVLINSQVLHQYIPPKQEQEETWASLLFEPSVIAEVDSAVYREFVEPITRSSCQYLVLDPAVPWQREIISFYKEAEALCRQCPPTVDLRLKQTLISLWIRLAEHMEQFPAYESRSPRQRRQERLRIMMRYIWEHYQEPITLTDIANEVHVSDRTAERCFKDEIQISPLLYLQNYRLRCARRMLLTQEDSILEIALQCGFESSSYFDRLFKRTYSITPRQFRQTQSRKNQPGEKEKKPVTFFSPGEGEDGLPDWD